MDIQEARAMIAATLQEISDAGYTVHYIKPRWINVDDTARPKAIIHTIELGGVMATMPKEMHN